MPEKFGKKIGWKFWLKMAEKFGKNDFKNSRTLRTVEHLEQQNTQNSKTLRTVEH